MLTHKELTKHAERLAIPVRTLEQVKADLDEAAKTDADRHMARLMVKFGRLTDEAREYARARM
jgi:hypothetical protein